MDKMRYRLYIFILLLFLSGTLYAGPLHEAAKRGDINRVRILMSKKGGVKVNALEHSEKEAFESGWGRQGATALHYAAESGHLALARFLIAKGADVNQREDPGPDNYPHSPLDMATSKGHLSMVKLLVSKGANADNIQLALRFAAGGRHLFILKFLIAKGADDYSEALYHAACAGNMGIARLLIAKGADVDILSHSSNHSFQYQETALYCAVQNAKIDMVRLLLAKGADVNAIGNDSENMTSLHSATGCGNLSYIGYISASPKLTIFSITKLLVDSGADLNVKESGVNGRTPLDCAVMACVLTSEKGEFALSNQYRKVAKYLISKGASSEILSKEKALQVFIKEF